MREIYRNPLRVYLILGLLALWGLLASFTLPISLFPNSSKPSVNINIPYGGLSADEFFKTHGSDIEAQLKGLLINEKGIDELSANYNDSNVRYEVNFDWGVSGQQALSEVYRLTASLASSWPAESRRSFSVQNWSRNSGFLAISFYSPSRSLEELYNDIEPILKPIGASVPDSSGVSLYNPTQKGVEIALDPEKLAIFQLLPSDIESALNKAGSSLSGGKLDLGQNSLSIEFPRELTDLESLKNLSIYSRSGTRLQLRDVADVQLKLDKDTSRIFKTSGVPSLILFASPKPEANVKKMADDIIAAVEAKKSELPKDVNYKVLVNPAEFIDSSIASVAKEVGLAALLAVCILLLFIGSLKNVITAAIEIPLSIIMAFIFMKIFGVNINLISLGGLALSAGMNVDASVVVMENIFRHFDLEMNSKKRLASGIAMNAEERLQTIIKAVKEVWLPITASTIASLVVFLPLIMTSGLTNGILGDLAKAVVFSHGMSAIVALVLVPTVRMQMMSSEKTFVLQSPIEKQFHALENFYAKTLAWLIGSFKAKLVLYSSVAVILVILIATLLPKLPREIIGRPETDWVILGFSGKNFTESRQLEAFAEKLEYDVLKTYDKKTAYTFTQINAGNGHIMLRLNKRKDMDHVWKTLQEKYEDTPDISYWVEPWNPSELPIPETSNVRLEVRGGTPEDRARVSRDLRIEILESKAFPRMGTTPNSSKDEQIIMSPNVDVLARTSGKGLSIYELANYVRIATTSKSMDSLSIDNKSYSVTMRLKENRVKTIEDLRALPIGLGEKIVPLNAFATMKVAEEKPSIFRLNQSELSLLMASENENNKDKVPKKQEQVKKIVADWQKKNSTSKVSVAWTEPEVDMKEALSQLKWALLLSILLIFVTMVVQFGDLVSAALVLVAIPLGFIGVIVSLTVFKSTLSLNSALGSILLSGIAVANSIILVDFMKKLVDSGVPPVRAAVEAAQARLRPILMTSLTTILGMTPIALGMGEGGKILQPLGIAVAGGLGVSMCLTIFIVPSLQATYLVWRERNNSKKNEARAISRTQFQQPHLDL